MISRLFVPPKESSYFLLGARGTGKSTLLREHYKESKYINLLDERIYQRLLADPGSFYDECSLVKPRNYVVVDEIQRLPNLLNEVHRLIEEKKVQFVLSGSSARKLKSVGVNLLGGRAFRKQLHPFTPIELKAEFNLESALRYGLFPIVWASKTPELTLEAYAQIYLKEEIQAEALVRNLGGFARFLPVAALFHAQTLNTASLARDAEVSRTTVDGYFGILEDTLLVFKVQAFESKIRVREKKKAKLYFIDSGLVRALKKQRGTVAHEERGALFEGLIAQSLRAMNDYQGLYDDLFYWAPAEAKTTEVDFLLQRGREFVAIECKSTTKLEKNDFKGLAAIADLQGLKRRILVYGGSVDRLRDGVEVLGLDSFYKKLGRGRI